MMIYTGIEQKPIIAQTENTKTVEKKHTIITADVPLSCGYDPTNVSCEIVEIVTPDIPTVKQPLMSEEDIKLISVVTMAEAEGECEKGKRLVIDSIFNRVDSEFFPDTVSGVIYQRNQFTSVWNGRMDKCYVTDDIYQLVTEELECRTNNDVIFFTAGEYGKFGKPMFSVGNHYFSSYK